MNVFSLSLEGLILIEPEVFSDERGCFLESYRKPLYFEKGIRVDFVQDNLVFSKKDTLRGMHFQLGEGQHKLVCVIRGKIFDVAVDIRKGSKTFGKWEGVILDDKTKNQLFVPAGFAHGYLVLSETAIVHYKVSPVYTPSLEKGFRYDDPEVKIKWPIEHPILSLRDKSAPFFKECLSSFGSI